MNDVEKGDAEGGDQSENFVPVTAEEFLEAGFEQALTQPNKVEPRDLSSQYRALARNAEAAQNHGHARVFSALSQVCGIHLRGQDRAEPWGPMFSSTEGRSAIPSDFKGEQSEAFAKIFMGVANPGLKARLADIVWSNDRKAGDAAATAIEAYKCAAIGLMDGVYAPYLETQRPWFEALKCLQRAFVIAQATTKKDGKKQALLPDELKAAALRLYKTALEVREYVVFEHTAKLCLHYGLQEASVVAADIEKFVAPEEHEFVMPVKALWDLAARLYRNENERDAEQRCRLRSIFQTLAMRKQVTSAGAEAHWVQQALLELRHVDGQDDLEDALFLDLRRLQRASIKEMSPASTPLGIEGVPEKTEELYESFSLAEALKRFGLITKSTPIEDMRKFALQTLRDFPMQGIMPIAYVDAEGKPIAHSPAACAEGEQEEGWFRGQALRLEEFRRQRAVAGWIEPARATIQARFLIEERHLQSIVARSPFVSPDHAHIILLGLVRYFQGDFLSATHLLILQLEPCLRHILKLNGADPVLQRDDGTEEDYDLNAMMTRLRPELEAILGSDWVFELNVLFVGRPGPSLRNALAHGQIGTAACFSPTINYACWMMFRLVSIFVIKEWDEVAADIAASA